MTTDRHVSFDADHACGQTHRATGWHTATPGLVVFLDAPANTPCSHHQGRDEWNIWHTATGAVVVGGFTEPESAMRYAHHLGHRRNWEAPGPIPDLAHMLADLDRHGL